MQARNFCIRQADVRIRRSSDQDGTPFPFDSYVCAFEHFEHDPADLRRFRFIVARESEAAEGRREHGERGGEPKRCEPRVNHAPCPP